VVGLYLNPPDRALVLCVDEKSQIQALDRTTPILPLRPGLPGRQTHDYKRHGTTTLFAAFHILHGKVSSSCLPRHRAKEFVRFLHQLEKEVQADQDVHLVMHNYSTHKSAVVQRWLKPKKRRRFHFRFTPTSSSWLNQVERLFGLITDRMIRRGTFPCVDEPERAIPSMVGPLEQPTTTVRLESHRRCHPRKDPPLPERGAAKIERTARPSAPAGYLDAAISPSCIIGSGVLGVRSLVYSEAVKLAAAKLHARFDGNKPARCQRMLSRWKRLYGCNAVRVGAIFLKSDGYFTSFQIGCR
jgi:hypothetical protein